MENNNHYSITISDDMISDNDFADIKRKNIFILLRMDGCIFCDLMKKDWFQTIKRKANDDSIVFVDIERRMLNDFMRKDKKKGFDDFNLISGFPSLFLYDTKKLIPYVGKRNCEGFVTFMNDNKKKVGKPLRNEAKKLIATKENIRKKSQDSKSKVESLPKKSKLIEKASKKPTTDKKKDEKVKKVKKVKKDKKL